MKYINENVNIPQENRKEINEKLLYVIENNLDIVTKQDVYSNYTGDGGLHGLNFDDYGNYGSFSQAKKEIECGQFFTPHELCKTLVDCLKPKSNDMVADLTCGTGNIFNHLHEGNCYGCELDKKAYTVAKYLYPDSNIENQNIIYYNPHIKFDYIIGNPPFNLTLYRDNKSFESQYFYMVKASELLKNGGIIGIIVSDNFLKDDYLNNSKLSYINCHFNFIGQIKLDSKTFKNVGVENFNTKIVFFQKHENPTKQYNNDYIDFVSSDSFYNEFIYPLLTYKNKNKLIQIDKEFEYNVNKFLYNIKISKNTKDKYQNALSYYNKFLNQSKPDNISIDEWEKRKLTENKVLSYLKNILKNQHVKQVDKIELVKTNYGLKYKAYSKSMENYLKEKPFKNVSFNDIIMDELNIDSKNFTNLINKKKNNYNNQEIKLKDINTNCNADFLRDFSIKDNVKNEIINLNEIQKNDLSKVLQKKYSLVNWCQGSGKSLAGLCFNEFNKNNVKRQFIIAPPIAINLTWKYILDNCLINDKKLDYICIENLEDVKKISENKLVLIPLTMLRKYNKQIKKEIKKDSYKVSLLFDESDSISNYHGDTTKAVMNCFRKVSYKLLMTGTTTRNNVNELYPQIELLYNNSVNMICECEQVYKEGKLTKDLELTKNKFYNKPFSGYFGFGLWKSCFCPSKVTVFGAEKDTQYIYNKERLDNIIQKTIITRTLEEITGKDMVNIQQIQVRQNESEKELYEIILNEFFKMLKYFKQTGNSRKDNLLRIIQQLKTMIKACSIPQVFSEYNSAKRPNKTLKIIDMIESKNERFCIGCTLKDTAKFYHKELSKLDRKVFYIDGETSWNNRQEIIKEFQNDDNFNSILVCTQQSLSSSANIPKCKNVIIESLQWNIPKISQFYGRFIRFNTKELVNVYFVNYIETIEQNILLLLMNKEKINNYIKTQDVETNEEVFKKFDLDSSIFNYIIEKVKEDGKTRLRVAETNL